jgi:hypothetical protein
MTSPFQSWRSHFFLAFFGGFTGILGSIFSISLANVKARANIRARCAADHDFIHGYTRKTGTQL